LEKRPWIKFGQILTLELSYDNVPSQIGWIVVDRYTDDDHCGARLLEQDLPDVELRKTLLDERILRSLSANPKIFGRL